MGQGRRREVLMRGDGFIGIRRGFRISARGGRQGNDDLISIWHGNMRFLTYANTDLQLFKMFFSCHIMPELC